MSKRWEYKIITLDCIGTLPNGKKGFRPKSKQEEELNDFGEYGWELIHFRRLPNSCDCCIIIKREKE